MNLAEAKDLYTIRDAVKARASAIDEIGQMPPSQELLARIAAMVEEGKQAVAMLRSIRLEIKVESRRWQQIQDTFVRNLGNAAPAHVNCRG
jgi:hypothetical protein